jgi:3-methyladenine DNA glycosylase Tag
MTKNKLLNILWKNEDSIITFRLADNEKDFILKKELEAWNRDKDKGEEPRIKHRLDICATTNFDSKYIKALKKRKFNTNGNVLVFSWTENKFRIINPRDVSNVTPLSAILKNESPKIEIYNG